MAAAVKGAQANPERPGCSGDPARFIEVFKEELGEIRCRRKNAKQLSPEQDVELSGELSGLALSGGGIRSATYCLGVLQKFRELNLLTQFDYLSTVSGGGFIGGWWSAWLSRTTNKDKGVFPPPEQIKPNREQPYRLQEKFGITDSSISAGVDPIHHVRLFSNYLTPRKGALSLDTWRAITVGFRNLLATWSILLPLMIVVILLTQLYFVYFQGQQFFGVPVVVGGTEWSKRVHLVLAPLIFLGGLFVTTSFAWVINTWDSKPQGSRGIRRLSMAGGFIAGVIVTGAGAYEVMWNGDPTNPLPSQLVTAVASLVWLLVAFVSLFWCCHSELFRKLKYARLRLPYYAPATVHKPTPDELGTRLTQASEVILVALVAVGVALGFFGSVQEFWNYVVTEGHSYAAEAGGWIAVLGSLASIAFTLWKASPTGGGDLRGEARRSLASQAVFAIAPVAALVIIGLLVAEAVDSSFGDLITRHSATEMRIFYWSAFAFVSISLFCLLRESVPLSIRNHRWCFGWLDLAYLVFLVALIVLGVLIHRRPAASITKPEDLAEFFAFTGLALMGGWVGTFGWYVDPNALSLHTFYKARLTRAYLGASNLKRLETTPEISDADSGDDLPLWRLQNCQSGAPYHLINTTLNLVGGHDLSTAQRLAEPFLLSKLYCGAVIGYRPAGCYMAGRLTLGTAMAVSGAAVSPNMGSMTLSSAVAMLMTFFNIRLGYWAPTPNHLSWRSPQARHWPWYTLKEFLSQTTDQEEYCYLSDGGHFDNTGVYSLVQRGCQFIVMVDCGADPKPCFQDLGDLIRRCRIDFGTEIDIDITGLTDAASPVTRCLRGTIKYSPEHLESLERPREDCSGTLILIKPSLTAKEASGKRAGGNPQATADIRQFRITNPDYPQISTADQWFSEAQFESYRQLGELSAETAAALLVIRLLTILFSW